MNETEILYVFAEPFSQTIKHTITRPAGMFIVVFNCATMSYLFIVDNLIVLKMYKLKLHHLCIGFTRCHLR